MVKKCIKLATIGVSFLLIGIIGIVVLAALGFNDWDNITVNVSENDIKKYVSDNSNADDMSEIKSDFNNADVDSVELSISMGTVMVERGNELSVTAWGVDSNAFSYNINENNSLVVKYEPDMKNVFDNNDMMIEITLPEKLYENLVINTSGGECNLSNINTKKFDINMSAGAFYADSLTVSESAKINISAIDASFNQCSLNNPDFNVTAGQLNCSDTELTGDTKINITFAEVNFNLIGYKRNQYTITTAATAGNVIIDGDDEDTSIKADYTIDVNLTGGSCNIIF